MKLVTAESQNMESRGETGCKNSDDNLQSPPRLEKLRGSLERAIWSGNVVLTFIQRFGI